MVGLDRLAFAEHMQKGDLDVGGKRQAADEIHRDVAFRRPIDGCEDPSRRLPPLSHDQKRDRGVLRERTAGAAKEYAGDRSEAARADDHKLLRPFDRGALDRLGDRSVGHQRRCWHVQGRQAAAGGLGHPSGVRSRPGPGGERNGGLSVSQPGEREARDGQHRHVICDREWQGKKEPKRIFGSRGPVGGEEDPHPADRGPGATPGLSGSAPLRVRGPPDGTIGLFSGVLRLTTRTLRRPSLDLVSTAAMILRAQEKERARVARELHDDTGQALTLLLVRLQMLADQIPDPRTRAELADLRALVARTMDGVRRIVVDLGPTVLDDLGLASSVEWLAERMRVDGRMRVDLDLDVDREPPRPVALAMFRVAQEALTNVLRHARASSVSVRLTRDDGHLRLAVSDDGLGFDVEAAERRSEESVGLLGMTERIALVGGELSIESDPGRGTTVVASVPIDRDGA